MGEQESQQFEMSPERIEALRQQQKEDQQGAETGGWIPFSEIFELAKKGLEQENIDPDSAQVIGQGRRQYLQREDRISLGNQDEENIRNKCAELLQWFTENIRYEEFNLELSPTFVQSIRENLISILSTKGTRARPDLPLSKEKLLALRNVAGYDVEIRFLGGAFPIAIFLRVEPPLKSYFLFYEDGRAVRGIQANLEGIPENEREEIREALEREFGRARNLPIEFYERFIELIIEKGEAA